LPSLALCDFIIALVAQFVKHFFEVFWDFVFIHAGGSLTTLCLFYIPLGQRQLGGGLMQALSPRRLIKGFQLSRIPLNSGFIITLDTGFVKHYF